MHYVGKKQSVTTETFFVVIVQACVHTSEISFTHIYTPWDNVYMQVLVKYVMASLPTWNCTHYRNAPLLEVGQIQSLNPLKS